METAPQDSAPRPPGQSDIIELCRALNTHDVRYIVVGGMAVIRHGYLRATENIDLLVDESAENIERVRQALEILPDKAIRQMTPDDLRTYTVVRIADEIVVDLMLRACGISYGEAEAEIDWTEIEGVSIPFASVGLLIKMKQTGREQDRLDLMFLLRRQAAQ